MAMYRAGYVPDLVARERDGFSDRLFGCQSEKEGRLVESVESFDQKVEINFSFHHCSILDINVWRIRSILGVDCLESLDRITAAI
jgi:hypothetical protein